MRTKYPPRCECGCGEFVNWSWDYEGWCKFLKGHNSRVMTQEQKDKIAATLIGYKHTKEARHNMSLGGQGRVFSEVHRSRLSKPGELNSNWKGGRFDADGYVMVYAPNHPYKSKDCIHIQEHRLIMEQHIGRYLQPDEIVHHINRIKNDNRIENLEIKNQSVHFKEHKIWLMRSCFNETSNRNIDR